MIGWLIGPIAGPLFGVLTLVSVAFGGWQTIKVHRQEAEIARLEGRLTTLTQAVKDAATLARQQQAAEDAIARDAAVRFAESQQKIKTVTRTITKEVQVHVKDTITCVSYGLVRVLDAAAIRTSIDALALPSGAVDDTCAPITPSALASAVADNYGETALAIAEVQVWREWYERIRKERE